MGLVHSFHHEAEGASSFGGNLYQPLPGAQPKRKKYASQDNACINSGDAGPIANADDGQEEGEHGQDEVIHIIPVEVFDGADVFQEDGDLVGLSPYFICHMDTLIGENDLIIVGADQQAFVG